MKKNNIFSPKDTSQENKVTITLIAVVILFFVCQTPNALQLLNIIHLDTEYHTNRTKGMFERINCFFSVLA